MPEYNLPIIQQIQNALVEVKPLIDVGGRNIPAETVKKVNEITTRLGQRNRHERLGSSMNPLVKFFPRKPSAGGADGPTASHFRLGG